MNTGLGTNAQWSMSAPDESGTGLEVQVAPGLGHVVVSVTGDIDMTTEQAFRDVLMGEATKPARRRVVVDLAGVGFMASAGLHALLTVNERVKAAGGSLIVARAQPVVARVLSLTGVDEEIPVVGDVGEALRIGPHLP
jgi:anti-sigma B factor antagonist